MCTMQSLKALVIILVFLTLLLPLSTSYAYAASASKSSGSYKVRVLVTIGCLARDVELVGGDKVVVYTLIPAGVDPHNYYLKPRDILRYSGVDIVFSTNHTPVEIKLDELIRTGVFKVKYYVVINDLPEAIILREPSTKILNQHMIIYDVENYILFLKCIEKYLSLVNPSEENYYSSRLKDVLSVLGRLYAYKGLLSGYRVVVSQPPLQYAAYWLGARVLSIVSPASGIVSEKALYNVYEGLANGSINAVFVCSLSPYSFKPCSPIDYRLAFLASRFNATVIPVLWPLYNSSMLFKLENLVYNVESSLHHKITAKVQSGGIYCLSSIILALSLLIPVFWFRRFGFKRMVVSIVAFASSSLLIVYSRLHWGLITIAWAGALVSASVSFSQLSPVVGARRLFFLAAAMPHVALLSASLSFIASRLTGFSSFTLMVLIGVLLTIVVALFIGLGVDPDRATAIFVGVSSSLSIIMLYYLVTRYSMSREVYALIMGDPSLAGSRDYFVSSLIALSSSVYTLLFYESSVYAGLDRESFILTGARVWFYDLVFYILLAVSITSFVRIVGFILAHVFILIPGAFSSLICRRSRDVLLTSMVLSVLAACLGFAFGMYSNLSPTGLTGVLLAIMYLVMYGLRRAGLC